MVDPYNPRHEFVRRKRSRYCGYRIDHDTVCGEEDYHPIHRSLEAQQKIDASNRYHAYMQGWVAGAKCSSMDPKATGHADIGIRDAYDAGYRAGRIARNAAAEKSSFDYGYIPTVLRLQDEG